VLKFARPDVNRLVFQAFGRTVHPELLTSHREITFGNDDVRAQVKIVDAGHVLTVRCGELVCAEVLTTQDTLLPQRLRWVSHRVHGTRDASHKEPGLVYETSCDLEVLDADLFARYQLELNFDAFRAAVSHAFHDGNRLRTPALSFIDYEMTSRVLQVRACHTFPENRAVVKSQSRWEF